jgi:hypothetical protein
MKIIQGIVSIFLLSLFFASCQKDDIENRPPVVNAGRDTVITLNATTGNNISLSGSATDADGSVVSYLWSQVSGPNRANIETAGASSTIVNGLISGVYVFQLMATDDDGAIGSKTVSVTIVQNNQTPTGNKPPVVNAGNDTTFALKNSLNDTITLKGSATDADGTVIGFSWTQISGPTSAKILYPGSASTKVTNVATGSYIFQLTATDDKGATGIKTVTVVLQAAPIITLNLQPHQNQMEVHFGVWGTTGESDPNAPELVAAAWTRNGDPLYYRGLLRFDLSSIPSTATIVSAKLTLYSNPTPLNGNLVDANSGTNNSMYVQRVSTSWASTVTWQNQPSTVTTSQISVPSTTQSRLDLVDMDVTNLVKDMQQLGNFGFMIKLQNETTYNCRIFCSSKYSDATKHPKLVIQYNN